MKKIGLVTALLMNLAAVSHGQTSIVSDAFLLGQLMVGTTTTLARMTVVPSSATNSIFQVSGVDLTPFLRVASDGKIGISTYSSANVDVMGSGDSSSIGLMLHSGYLHSSSTRTQVTFASGATANQRHAITSVHLSSSARNGLNFLIWTPDAGTTSIATMTVLSLVTISSASGASVHVRPVGDPTVELVVSNGGTTGGGTIHVAAQVTPSSRNRKSNIAYLGDNDRLSAYQAVKNLKPVSFRYMKRKGDGYARDPRAQTHRGLLFEESPENLRGPDSSLSLDQRLLESEMAFQVIAARLERLENEVSHEK